MFFYDKTLELYINDSPLLISSQVEKALHTLGETVKWNANGFVWGVSHGVAKRISAALGITALSVREYMHLALRQPIVMSSDFAEWLQDTYTYSDGRMCPSDGPPVAIAKARPGWFSLDTINERGLPVDLHEHPGNERWKFWSLEDPTITSGALRSYVTSSGTCSLDLGIPLFAHHPNIMIREAYRTSPHEASSPLEHNWADCQALETREGKDGDALKRMLLGLSDADLRIDAHVDAMVTDKKREMVIDLKGKRDILAKRHEGLKVVGVEDLMAALPSHSHESKTFVLGHTHPDADAIVSAIYEAARRNLLSGQRTCRPLAEYLPAEVRTILGESLSVAVGSDQSTGHRPVILVDCQKAADSQAHAVRGVIDHHPCTTTYPYFVAQSIGTSWSTTLQIYVKFIGSGFELGPDAARILAEATVLEAEPELMDVMRIVDKLAMERLIRIASSITPYAELMAVMLDGDVDLETMFWRDYKEDGFGFAVTKHRRQQQLDFSDLAIANNASKQLPLTIVKQVQYDSTFVFVDKETITAIFNPASHDDGFRHAVLDVLHRACLAFHPGSTIEVTSECVTVRGTRRQTPRLLLMPLISALVAEHNKFAYSSILGRYIACGFYSGLDDDHLYGSPGSEHSPATQLSFEEVKALLRGPDNVSFLSLKDYWAVLTEFAGCDRVKASLTNSNFVELLDTVITSGFSDTSLVAHGNDAPVAVNIPSAQPAQLRPHRCCPVHGIPTKVVGPNVYDDSTLWRYWSPDAAINVATRGHIFVLNRPCVDLKIKPKDRTKQLTFRPVYKAIPDLRYDVELVDGCWLNVTIQPRLFSIFEHVAIADAAQKSLSEG